MEAFVTIFVKGTPLRQLLEGNAFMANLDEKEGTWANSNETMYVVF